MNWVRLNSTIERNRTHRKRKNQSNPNERSIFELVICVKQALKIHNQILEAQVTWARSVAHVFFVSEEIPQKWFQMRCGLQMYTTSDHLLWFWPMEKNNFIVAFTIMAVRCSKTSNILMLVHLLHSWSLLIVQGEFERIIYVVSELFLMIIHLLYAVACVAISNLLEFLHKSNPSSCLAAI